MNYRRVLLIVEPGSEPNGAIDLIRRVAPAVDLLHVVVHAADYGTGWFSGDAPGDLDERLSASIASFRARAASAAARVDVELASHIDAGELEDLAAASQIDLIAAIGRPSARAIGAIAELRKRRSLPVLWSASVPATDRPLREIRCEAIGGRARVAVAAFLRDHTDAETHATVVMLAPQVSDLRTALGVAGILAKVELVAPPGPRAVDLDLLVLARFPRLLWDARASSPPILILPPLAPPAPVVRRAIDVADLADDGGLLRASIHFASGMGRCAPIPDQEVVFVSAGRIAAVITTHNGQAELPRGIAAESFGVFRAADRTIADPIAAIEQDVAVIRPGTRALLLVDSDLADAELALLPSAAREQASDVLAIRMRPVKSCASIRDRFRKAGLSTRVADASAVLDEGEALDVPEAMDAVRLARVGARLRAAGFPVAAIVHRAQHTPLTIGFAALRATDLHAAQWTLDVAASGPPSLARRLAAITGAPLIAGNRVELEMDNAKARRWLLEAIAGSKQRVSLQLYMALDDDVGAPVEAALAAAGARGVTVRVVVDSLHGFEGSYGAKNPLLERLRTRPGVELCASRPVTGVPTLEDVKQRDHRKIAVIDGTVALIGGRNLSHEYYAGFDEVPLTPHSLWRQVPWLDAGARVEGPAVAALERSFLEAWRVAGGAPYEIIEPPAAGTTAVRVVLHRGLRDACTLEAYLALIETATSHVYAVNGFPLVLEMQHALIRAVRRGVRVKALFGNLTPTHDGTPFGGPWSSARTAATDLVHSRIDALVAAGGEGYQLTMPQQPAWSGGLGAVNPHVHAKVMSVDGRVCSVGSANLDITAGYWESELMLVVEDSGLAAGFEAHIDRLIAGSQRVDRDDPAWQRTARRRNWMRYWPGNLSI